MLAERRALISWSPALTLITLMPFWVCVDSLVPSRLGDGLPVCHPVARAGSLSHARDMETFSGVGQIWAIELMSFPYPHSSNPIYILIYI